MASEDRFTYPRPAVRPLKIYAYDPMEGRNSATRISIDTRNEPVAVGPHGARVQVIDYDTKHHCFYTPVDLNDPAVLMQGGIDHSESDPRFHQQMVYAVSMRIIEVFDRALGRPIDLGTISDGRPRPLRIFPHAFEEANAFFTPQLGALMFGYFRAGESEVGETVPGQMIFSCLSHDIVAHELTHALVMRLSPFLSEGRHPDSIALHESFADLVLLLHRFSIEPVLRDEIRRTRGMLGYDSPFVKIASQFAAALGREHGLRNPMKKAEPNEYEHVHEPHARGAILMSAVFEALFETYRGRVADLFQIAGTQWASDGEVLHPDLVNRIADEAARTALSILTMSIRAFDYLPPLNITFGDFLRATVTADRELVPTDTFHQRANLIDAFRRRGIYATGARSLAEESLMWEGPHRKVPPLPGSLISALTTTAQAFARIRPGMNERSVKGELDRAAKNELAEFARKHARALHLSPDRPVNVTGLRHSFRVGPDGQLVIEIIGQIIQTRRQRSNVMPERGVTIVASADGKIRYVIPNQPLPPLGAPARNADHVELAPESQSRRSRASTLPFDSRYRLSKSVYRRDYPHLCPTDRELRELEGVFLV